VTGGLPPRLAATLDLIDERLPEPIAEIHGTVDLERRLEEIGQDGDAVGRAVDDTLLGARVVLIDGDRPPAIALAEPTTEGRLAAALARRGEGRIGEYLALPGVGSLTAIQRRARAVGVSLSTPGSGPFGPGVVVLGGPIGGYQLIIVERRSLPSAR
jgi:hypothetical protein